MSLQLTPSDLPCKSFFEYACSKNKTVYPMIGQNLKNGVVKHLVDELAARNKQFSAKTKALNFFQSCKHYMNIDICYEQFFKYFRSLLAYVALTSQVTAYDNNIFNTVKSRFLHAIGKVPLFTGTKAKYDIDRKFEIIEKRKEYLNIDVMNSEYSKLSINTTKEKTFEIVVAIGLYLHQSHDKPISYFYPSFNVHLWKDLYYDVLNNETILNDVIECLQLPESMSMEDKRTAASYFEAIESSWNEFAEWLDESDLTDKVNDQENLHLREYNLNTKRLFFIIYAQSLCHHGKTIVDNILVEGLKHSSEFASTFFCSEGSPMNPEGKCETPI
ncbi:uncharacterized protein LOC129612674 [Condylostylus longicornis]|uniref:uncharacterized protein LOC129612674 n=1 Tax=Condylostylus longicornis TaxID=2530218 RepID=UPI00244E11F8|nr:uncharacterized protein LOC129612674 [Condylostylus longicornis]